MNEANLKVEFRAIGGRAAGSPAIVFFGHLQLSSLDQIADFVLELQLRAIRVRKFVFAFHLGPRPDAKFFDGFCQKFDFLQHSN